ncbi:flocculation-associated PEP-CTERM protein PepA [Paucibacter sp. B2R-40]|uniref:flocculation-associated PEP-CTERM protein PepA n=1 Tax=Paucibacter sp. B2R-40 TaxID=2893554 RepID=UPI0021E3B448|nr:flocculation-associated PEP-CTERM protein PepA [Paucibacter sp. B2R-40]MCV2356467.1 flocculation-associated PEP-CTERM protein PepA [Paucibacter sp. B2R-40]
MKTTFTSFCKPLLQRSAMTLALTTVCASAMAAPLPQFTFDPAAAGLAGTSFTGDNILISNYSSVLSGPGGSFTESGYLSFGAMQLGGSTFSPTGLNETYGLYVAFTGTGMSSAGNPATGVTFGTFTSLNYTLYGYNGTASFGFSGSTPTETATGEVVLATGSLISGAVVTIPSGDGVHFTPSAAANLTFNVDAGQAGFFQSPSPFYGQAITAFTNTSSQVLPVNGGFLISQGGGSINFAAAVPEPESYMLMLAGLAAMAFVARRRSTKP